MGTMLSDIQSASLQLEMRFIDYIQMCDDATLNVFHGWREESGPVAIWNKKNPINGDFSHFLSLATICGVQMVYANIGMLDLWEFGQPKLAGFSQKMARMPPSVTLKKIATE